MLEFSNNLWGARIGTDYVLVRQATQAGGIDPLESIPVLIKNLKIPALITRIGSRYNIGRPYLVPEPIITLERFRIADAKAVSIALC